MPHSPKWKQQEKRQRKIGNRRKMDESKSGTVGSPVGQNETPVATGSPTQLSELTEHKNRIISMALKRAFCWSRKKQGREMVRAWWVGNRRVGKINRVPGFALHINIIKINIVRFQSLIFLIIPKIHGPFLTKNEQTIMGLLDAISRISRIQYLPGCTTASKWVVVTWITLALLTG
jgi:hypothetical protein